jgi:hypothetical protein
MTGWLIHTGSKAVVVLGVSLGVVACGGADTMVCLSGRRRLGRAAAGVLLAGGGRRGSRLCRRGAVAAAVRRQPRCAADPSVHRQPGFCGDVVDNAAVCYCRGRGAVGEQPGLDLGPAAEARGPVAAVSAHQCRRAGGGAGTGDLRGGAPTAVGCVYSWICLACVQRGNEGLLAKFPWPPSWLRRRRPYPQTGCLWWLLDLRGPCWGRGRDCGRVVVLWGCGLLRLHRKEPKKEIEKTRLLARAKEQRTHCTKKARSPAYKGATP